MEGQKNGRKVLVKYMDVKLDKMVEEDQINWWIEYNNDAQMEGWLDKKWRGAWMEQWTDE